MAGDKGQGTLMGRCRCGNVRYRYTTVHTAATLAARRCDCGFCRRHGAIYTADPEGELVIELTAEEAVHYYRFASRAVAFLLCANCGVLTAALCDIDGNTYAVINTNTLEPPIAVLPAGVDFSGETPEDAQARRKRHWIGRVELRTPDGVRDLRQSGGGK